MDSFAIKERESKIDECEDSEVLETLFYELKRYRVKYRQLKEGTKYIEVHRLNFLKMCDTISVESLYKGKIITKCSMKEKQFDNEVFSYGRPCDVLFLSEENNDTILRIGG